MTTVVRDGETVIGSRRAIVRFVRVRHANKAWGFYTRAIVRFLDTGEALSMGAAEFGKWSTQLDREAAKAARHGGAANEQGSPPDALTPNAGA